MQQPTDDIYARARQIVFRAGGKITPSDDAESRAEAHEIHLLLDELLGMLGYLEDRDQQRLADLAASAETIREMEDKASSFDSVLASEIMQRFLRQQGQLESIVSALGRLGAVVEGADQ